MQEGFFMKNKNTPSLRDYSKHPDTSFDLINKYGTQTSHPKIHQSGNIILISLNKENISWKTK